MKNIFFALSVSLYLVACQAPSSPTQTKNQPTSQATAPQRSIPMLSNPPANGTFQLKNKTLTLTLDLPELPDTQSFSTQKLDLSTTTRLFAEVSDSHGKTYAPVGADINSAVNYTSGTITLVFHNIAPDELLFVNVQAKNGTTPIPQAELATVIKHTTDASPISATLNFQTTVAARALKAMLPDHATQARSINLNDLNTLTAAITGVGSTAPNFTYNQNHPSLVNTDLLATHLQSQAPNTLTASDYRQNGATVNLNISGLADSDKVQVQITDAASAVRTNLGNGITPITGVTPGNDLKLIVTPFGSPVQSYSYHVSPTTLNLSEGASTPVTITANPNVSISGFSPSSGTPGSSVTINGTGFIGTTAVRFNGVDATSFTVNSNTQITATVPDTATDGMITVVNANNIDSANSFDVHRVWYVKHDASGSQNGTSWANAFTSLQTALSASQSNDDIWIAAGRYIPGTSRNDSFSLRENVDIYGGFNGTETTLAARNFRNNVVTLSGDINNNDDYSTTPAGNISDNSYHVVIGGNATLDGVTIQGGNADFSTTQHMDSMGSGLLIDSGPAGTLRNILFKHNNSTFVGGCLFIKNNTTPLHMNNITFQHCSNPTYGAAAYMGFINIQEIKNVIFDKNISLGGEIGSSILRIDAIYNSWVFENSIFTNNSGSQEMITINAYNPSSAPVSLSFKNTLIANNNVRDAALQVYGDSSGTFKANNVTLANNQCSNQGSGFCISNRVSGVNAAFSMSNTLYWKDSIDSSQVGINGNTNLGTGGNPFFNINNPIGPDNLWFTADDGFNFANSSIAGIDEGVTGADIPVADIANRPRSIPPDAGAYEYTP